MKYLYLSILLIGLLACRDNRKAGPAKEVTEKDTTQVTSQKAPFKVLKFDQFEQYLHQEDDKVHVINFWATFCPPCIKEMPYFEKLNKTSDTDVLLVSLDMGMMIDDDLKPFLKKHPIDSELVVLDDPDSETWIPKVSRQWNSSLPATLIYKNGDSKFYERPFKSYHELAEAVDNFN